MLRYSKSKTRNPATERSERKEEGKEKKYEEGVALLYELTGPNTNAG